MSFDVRWAGGGDKVPVRDERFGFSGDFVTGPATISFTAAADDDDKRRPRHHDGRPVVYRSDRSGQYSPGPEVGGAGSPAVGRERNGVFFH